MEPMQGDASAISSFRGMTVVLLTRGESAKSFPRMSTPILVRELGRFSLFYRLQVTEMGKRGSGERDSEGISCRNWTRYGRSDKHLVWEGRWGGRRDLNPRQPDPQSGALTKLSYDHHDRENKLVFQGEPVKARVISPRVAGCLQPLV